MLKLLLNVILYSPGECQLKSKPSGTRTNPKYEECSCFSAKAVGTGIRRMLFHVLFNKEGTSITSCRACKSDNNRAYYVNERAEA